MPFENLTLMNDSPANNVQTVSSSNNILRYNVSSSTLI